jgi:hypothetical protein
MNLYRYVDLKAKRIVDNRTQLKNLQKKHGFPKGFLLSPRTRVFEGPLVDDWVEARRRGTVEPLPLQGAAAKTAAGRAARQLIALGSVASKARAPDRFELDLELPTPGEGPTPRMRSAARVEVCPGDRS